MTVLLANSARPALVENFMGRVRRLTSSLRQISRLHSGPRRVYHTGSRSPKGKHVSVLLGCLGFRAECFKKGAAVGGRRSFKAGEPAPHPVGHCTSSFVNVAALQWVGIRRDDLVRGITGGKQRAGPCKSPTLAAGLPGTGPSTTRLGFGHRSCWGRRRLAWGSGRQQARLGM